MKILVWFVSVIIVLMMCIPCMDSSITITSNDTSYQNTSPSSNPSHVLDACSPFCTCVCCSIPNFVEHRTVLINAPELQLATYTEKAIGKATSADLSVWQPPRLG